MKIPRISNYYDEAAVAGAVERGEHREVIGSMWDEIGPLQLRFLQANGLTPDSTLLDIGCGSLRLGVRAVEYLEPGNYWGTDLNPVLLDAGYDKEIVPAGLAARLPRSHLVVDEEFEFPGIPSRIDFAIATSVFTHLPFNYMRLCLARLGAQLISPSLRVNNGATSCAFVPSRDRFCLPGLPRYARDDEFRGEQWRQSSRRRSAGSSRRA